MVTRAEAIENIVTQYGHRVSNAEFRDSLPELISSLRALGATEAEIAEAIPSTGR